MRVDIPGVAKGEQANQRSVAHVSSIVLFGMLGFLMLTLMPGLVGGLSDIVGATPAQAGLTASCELGAQRSEVSSS